MNYAPKPGRATKAPRKIPEVETLPCGTDTHRLTNRMERGEAVTRCVGCGLTWGELDAEARG